MGGSIVVYKNHEVNGDSVRCDITVLDTLGKEIISYSFGSMIETGALQISPDGKIFGARTYKKDVGECLFFLDVETGRTKVVKAVGEVKGKKWSASPSLLKDKKIHLSGGWHHIDKAQSAITSFDEIPSDISTLFGGEK
ncbi:MAG: hypothetical protein ABIN61_07065 [candidate division WOR-3 bacterium]